MHHLGASKHQFSRSNGNNWVTNTASHKITRNVSSQNTGRGPLELLADYLLTRRVISSRRMDRLLLLLLKERQQQRLSALLIRILPCLSQVYRQNMQLTFE